jgi:hypothetical protein
MSAHSLTHRAERQLSLKANFWNLDQGNPVLEHDILYAGLRGFPLSSEDLALIGQ